MLTEERIWQLWREANNVHTVEVDMAFARMIEEEAVKQEREACIEAVMAERVDAEVTKSNEDESYNYALIHAAQAIRSRTPNGSFR